MYSISKKMIIKPAPLVNSCGAKTIVMNIQSTIADCIRTKETQFLPYSEENMKQARRGYKTRKITVRRTNGHGQRLTHGEFITIRYVEEKQRKSLDGGWKQLIKSAKNSDILQFPSDISTLAARYIRSIGRFAYRVGSDKKAISYIIQDQKR